MAAALNGLLARQKSVEEWYPVSGQLRLRMMLHGQIDHGAISRLLLPAVLEFQGDGQDKRLRYAQLKPVFSIPLRMGLPEGYETVSGGPSLASEPFGAWVG